MTRNILRIANCSGFYGDRMSAAAEMVNGGPIDVLTGDYLAELTMFILWKSKKRHSDAGYATTFVTQCEEVLGSCLERGIKIVSNAGGLNCEALATRLSKVASNLGFSPNIAYLRGDDLLDDIDRLEELGIDLRNLDTGATLSSRGVTPLSANAYIGGWGITEALRGGADIVICPRVADASLVVGPSAWYFEWKPDDWDRLAGAVAAGHILECGAQATGGNFSFFDEIKDLVRPGFPIAEMGPDGSAIITKHEGTGGLVSVDTVTAQLLYEIQTEHYVNPDVVALFDTIKLTSVGKDRVQVSGVKGLPAPDTLKVCINFSGGWRNSATFILTGLDINGKAALLEEGLWDAVGSRDAFDAVDVQLIRSDAADADRNVDAIARLVVTVKDHDEEKVGRRFFNAVISLGLSSYPGLFMERADRQGSEYGIYWPTLVPADFVTTEVVFEDRVVQIPQTPRQAIGPRVQTDATAKKEKVERGATTKLPLGTICGARSGDKGGNANVGLWARTDETYEWLRNFLDIETFRRLLPESANLAVKRYELANIRGLNFVVEGILDEGVASTTRFDAQAKGLGEYLRSRLVDIPARLIPI